MKPALRLLMRGAKPTAAAVLLMLPATACAVSVASDGDATSVIDPVAASPDQFVVVLENDHVRVIEYHLAPGEKDVPHTHPPKVSYVISGGKLLISTKDGQTFEADEDTGATRWDDERPWHHVENIGQTPVRILLIEVKSANESGQ